MFDLIFGYPPENIATALFAIFGIAKAIVILTPTPKDDLWVQRCYKFVEVCALVVGRSKDGYEKPLRKEVICPNCHAEVLIEHE